MNDDKLKILLTEYQTLKDEEKTIFSFQFTILSIWITCLGMLLRSLFEQIQSIENVVAGIVEKDLGINMQEIASDTDILAQNREMFSFILFILIPVVCALFCIIWLDLSTRVIKRSHYIFIIEHKILKQYSDTIGFEHFDFDETKNMIFLLKTNNIYYCLPYCIMFLYPFLIHYFYQIFAYINPNICHYFMFFTVIEVFSILMIVNYMKLIFSYSKKKSEILSEERRRFIC